MTTSLNPSPALPEVHFHMMNNQTPVVSSLDIARHFQKKHKHVLDDIQRIISVIPKTFHEPNFRPMFTDVKIGNGAVRKDPAYNLTRDAFSLLVMGFTGAAALRWKLRYIEAFNAIEHTALTQYAELAREAGYAQGLKEAQSAPALQIAQRQAYLDGLTEGKGEAAKLKTAPHVLMDMPPYMLALLKKAVHYTKCGLTIREVAKVMDKHRRNISHVISVARKIGLLPAYVRPAKVDSRLRGNDIAGGTLHQFALSSQRDILTKPDTIFSNISLSTFIQGAAHD